LSKAVLVIALSMLLTGCLSSTTASIYGSSQASLFTSGLQSLEQGGSTADLEKLAAMQSDSKWSVYARSVLKIHDTQQKNIRSLQKENNSLVKENKTLQGNLDKLNQINLELEKRRN